MTVDLTKAASAATPEELAAELSGLPGRLAFRGQGKGTFKLTSSLKRRLAGIAPDERRRIEQRIVSSFVNALGDRLESSPQLGAVLALMQHHGAPTRLIDFSRSPFVGIYFAVEDVSDEDGRIFVMDIDAMLDLWFTEAARIARPAARYEVLDRPSSFLEYQETNLSIQVDEAIRYPLPFVPVRASDRMRAQSGLFLAEPLSRDWTEDIGKLGLFDSFTVPAGWKRALLTLAVRTNNSAGTLFPGIDGVGREIVEREIVGERLL